MPRSAVSPAGKVLAFFNSTDLPMAGLVLGLAQDAVRERERRSSDAKARARGLQKPATATPRKKRTAKAVAAKA